MYQLDEQEYIGGLNGGAGDLYHAGFEHPPKRFFISLEAAKQHPADESITHDFSYRKRLETMPECVEGTGLEGYDPEQLQYHLHGFHTDGEIELYSHLELAPDLSRLGSETWREAAQRALNHLDPTWEHPARDKATWTYLQGEAPQELLEIVESQPST